MIHLSQGSGKIQSRFVSHLRKNISNMSTLRCLFSRLSSPMPRPSFKSRISSARRFLNTVTVTEAVSCVQSNDSVFVQGAAMTPKLLVKALSHRAGPHLKNVTIVSIHTAGNFELAYPESAVSFRPRCLFVGPNTRKAVEDGRADYIPCFLHEIPDFFRRKVIPIDVCFVQVSPPDTHGFCSLGTSVDVTVAACEVARIIVAQVNPKVPRTHGGGILHVDQIDYAVPCDYSIHDDTLSSSAMTEIHQKIGRNVASLVEDGSTIQAGIGVVPDSALQALTNHKNLGIHTELFSDGLMTLLKKGVVTNSQKVICPNKSVTALAFGSKELMDFVDNNMSLLFMDCSFTNDTNVIRKNPRVVAINSAIEVDLTGQVAADSIGTRIYSGVGGQMDFIRGAALTAGGKPIIALTSRTHKNIPRIVPLLSPGAGVVTTRAHVYYIVTEYGVAHLYGKSLRERANELIRIAHPDDREMLERANIDRLHIKNDVHH